MLCELFLLIDFTNVYKICEILHRQDKEKIFFFRGKIIVFGKIVGESGEKSILHPLVLMQMNASQDKFRRKEFV